jgi:hypothetical protein
MCKTTALAIFGLRGAQNPHVHLRTFRFLRSVRTKTSCAPCASKLAALATFLARFW